MIRLPFSTGSNGIQIFYSSLRSVIIRTSFGVTVQTVWPHFVRVTAPGCNNGFILNGDQCVPPTSCGCYHQGRYRESGEQFWDGEECQSLCTCNGTTGNVHCTPNSCGPQESCRVVEGEFGCHPNPHGTCYASGDPHYFTFDHKAYDFQGTCRYTLVTLCNATDELSQFSVEAKNEAWNGLTVSVTAEVFVNVWGYHLHMSRDNIGVVKVNGITQNLPILLNGSQVSIFASGFQTIVNTDFGLSVMYDGWIKPMSLFYLTVLIKRGKTCGLCGNFNGNSNDDFYTPSGVTVASPDEFGQAWKVPGNYTCSDGCGSSCPRCANEQPARDQCEVIQAADGPFSFCHEVVHPAPYFNDCVFDVCVAGNQGHDLLCRALETYVRACHSANVRIYPWRQNTTCTLDCPANSHYELCGTDCGHTCARSNDSTCEQACSEGCFCDEGYRRSGTSCVPVARCGCQHNGFYYNAGESFWTDGCSHRCECHAPNDLRCSAESCTPAQQCSIRDGQLGCYDAMSTCTVWGDPHYITFDGAVAHFQGTCSYIIAESTNHGTNETQFQVIATNNHRGNNRVSFVSAVDIYLSNYPESVHIRIGPNKRAMVNGGEVSLPTTAGTLAQVVREGSYIIVDALDLVVQFDGQSTLLVRIAQNRQNRVTGMCGNFNGDSGDDKVSPSGTPAQNDNDFGQSWKSTRSQPGCGSTDEDDDGLNDCTFREEYSQLCSVITNTTGPFSACHLHSDPEPFFTSCVYDLCLYTPANGMLCSAVSAYERTCSVLGLVIPDWRSGLLCASTLAARYQTTHGPVPVRGPGVGDRCHRPYITHDSYIDPLRELTQYTIIPNHTAGETCAQKCTCTSTGLQCRNQPCSFSQICQQTSFQFSCQTVPRGTCTISGDPHYYTFDDTVFHFQGTCTYVLSEQCNSGLPYYRVEGKNEHRGSTRVSWTRLVKVHVYNDTIELVKGRRGQAKVNGNFASTPFSLSNDTVQVYESGFSVFVSTDFGLVVSYDTNHYVQISLPYTYQNATCGLCGNFNGIRRDDFQTREGEVVSSDVVFANSWQASGDDEPGCGPQCGGLDCAVCTVEETALYSNTGHCGILSSSSGPFAACHQQLPPQSFADSCVYDLCVGGGYQPILCQALSVYASQCQQNGVQLPSWRRPGFCEIPCPANSHFESEGTGCPATCVNPNSTHNCPLPPQESCICDSGYILSGGVCVPHAECGCSFEGRYYRSGQTVILDKNCGRHCSCSYGSMTCQSHGCGPLESCKVEDGERGCRPNSYETCWIRGPGSYQTFDGLTYQYPGACRLTLTKVMGLSSHPNFMVTAEKLPRGQEGFVRILHFEAEGIHVSIEMTRNSKVKVNGQLIRLPFSTPSNRIQLFHSSIYSVIIRTSFGVTVQTVWPHFVRVTAPGVYNGSLGGLCGNYNGHPHDDFRTPIGFLVNSSQDFGDSWRDGSLAAHCVESMNQNSTTNYNSSEYCGILSSPDGPFVPCWSEVDPRQQVDVCVEITRGSSDPASTLCDVLRDYALMCQQKGVALGQWRDATGCALTCPSNSHYELCGTSCPSACPSLSFPFTCDTVCQEGCQCNSGFILNGDQCVPPTSCGCYHQGCYHQGGEQFWDGEECQSLCTCNGNTGNVRCTPNSCGPQESCRVVEGEFGCHPNPHGTCSASGDPHYITFDRKAYDFQGTCRYVLVTLCNATDELSQFSVEAKNEALNGRPLSTVAEVFVNVWGYDVHMSRDRRGLVNGVTRNLPIILNEGNVSIYATGTQILVSTNFGLSVTYNGYSAVFISVPPNYREKICGLCGNFNGNPNDDFHTPSGMIVTSPDEFGRAWKVPGNYTCNDSCGSSCPQCTNEQPARDQCEVIQAADGPFSFCHEEVDPAPYFNDCVFDVCLSGIQGHDLLCSAIESYVRACQSANVRIYPWRENTTCTLDCPANSHYELCGTDCGHTCASSIDETCEQFCSEGCFCDEGFIKSGTRCVPVESCGCQYDGFYYDAGESFWTDGCSQRCECHAPNDLRCSAASCTPEQQCSIRDGQLGCYDAMSTCTVWGDPHYITFDGAVAHFQGTCSYIIAESTNHGTNETQFQVIATNNHRGNNRVSFVSAVDIYLSNHPESVYIRIGPNKRVTVDGVTRNLPIVLNEGNVSIYATGTQILVSTNFGLSVTYNGYSAVFISVPPNYREKICGLCGNFNGNPNDDFHTPSGMIVTSPDEFGRAWKVPGNYTCNDGCGSACPQCTNEQHLMGPSNFCHEEVDPAPYFNDCVFDVCLSGNQGHDLLCSAIESYVSACQSANVRIYPWRENATCTLDCPANSHYELCGTDCGHTCASSIDETCEQFCSEGCFCDEGFIKSGTRCVPVESCGCQYDGFYYDSFWTDGCSQRCECHAPNDLRCSAASCTPEQQCSIRNGQLGCYDAMSTCTVWGDPHYITFDGAVAHFQGTCSYIIAESTNHGTNETQFQVIATNNHRGNNRVSFVSAVDIYLSNHPESVHIRIGPNKRVNGNDVSLPTTVGILAQVVRQGSYIVVDASDLLVQFDGQSTLLVRLGQNRHDRVTGMCGNSNNDPSDDKVLPNGTLAQNDNYFGHSWKSPTSQPGCGSTDEDDDGLNDCTFREEYSQLCSVITNTTGPFSACHLHSDPEPFFSSCVYDLCLYTPANGMLCSAVSAYERTCSVLGLDIPDWQGTLLPSYLLQLIRGNTKAFSPACPGSAPGPPPGGTCPEHLTQELFFYCFKGLPVQLGDSFWSDRTCAQKCTCTASGLQCRNQPCSFSQICQQTSFQFSCQTVQRRTCTISGDPHYYTFDNQVFHFQGTCAYVLSEQCNSGLPYYRVEGKNEHRGSTRVSWTRLVKVHVYNDTIELVKGRRGEVNGNFASTPFSLSNDTVQVYESGFSVVVSTDFGLMVSYDTNHYVQISVPYTYQNATCGLCGNFNNQPQDDFRTRQGELVSSDVVFADSWRASEDDDPGCGPQCAGLACAGCTAQQTALYSNTDHCGILSSSSGPFAACHQQLPPRSFVDSCVYDLCVGGGYQPILCQALSVYASQCQQNGIQLQSWRRPGFCEIPCPANSHFESEGTGCPATCINPNSTHNCPLPAQESCICDSGYILSGGVCVPHAECGCSFEGRYYRSGQTVILDENCGRRCSCSYGSMTCQPHGCGSFESCRVEDGERGCRPNSYETCWIRGPGSYQTFDGLTYQYPGACRLTLAKVMGLSSHPHFMVTAEKVPRGQQDFSNVLKFEAEGTQVSIFHSSIYSVIIRTSFGVTVQTVWPHLVRVTAPGVYSGSLGGLCGDYNGHPHDDFRTPNGVLVNSSQDFGDSWRDGSLAAHCVESMNQNSTTNYNSREYCGILSSPDGPFVPCWSVVDPRQQVDVCVEIMRGSSDPASTLCDALRDYALMCQQRGVALGQWRDATGCALTCPSNSHYELCGTSCPSACPSLSFPFTCDTVCQEGCQCNNGFILNGDQCVPPTSCGCYHQGRYRESGEQFWDSEECQSLCTCNGTTGNVRCTPNSCGPQESCRVVEGEFGCHPNPHGTCSASGDPHYITFDRKAYDFQGTCRYTLVTLCNATDELNQFSVEAKNEALNGRPLSTVAEVFVNVWGYDVHMSRDRRGLVDGVTRNLPIILNEGNVSIYATGTQILVSTNFGLSVTYNGYSAVFISLPPNYREKICGLCGNFNGNPNDDFHTPSGTIVTSPDEFGRAWKVPGNYTCNDGCGSSCPQCTNEQPARDQCEVIQAADGPFSFCHEEVDPAPYFNDCVFDVCLSGIQGHDLLCSAIESYVSACQSANVRIYPWRENTTCTLDCPANSHYELCGTDCGHTCASSIDETCEQFCSEGCFCDEGFIKSGTRCVPVESCGCQYDGFYYDAGESFWTDGCSQRCECHAPNDLRCSAASCTPAQECSIRDGQLGCYDAMSTCTVWGDPHYITFDGAVAHFQGTCSYIITESTNHDIVFSLVAFAGFLQVNGNFASTPFSLRNDTVQVYESGFSVFVSTDFGLVVSYDTNHYVQISLPYTYQNATCGLCGNFNGIRRDDFQTREGEVVSSDVVFANSWQASGDDEPGCGPQCAGLDCAVCTVEETALYSNTDHCGILSSSSGPFAACHQQLPPQSFADSCVYDLCVGGGYQPILCQALSVYASQCQQNGVQLPSWRRPGFCEIPCPANSHFESEGTGCPATCVNPNSTHNCPLPSQESCICDSGYILSGGVCVPHAECGCSFEGRYYRSGQTVILDENCGRRCSCSYGSMTCQSHGCGPLESCKVEDGERGCRPNSYETCWIRGPGSYQTFDGLTYQYPGACRLTLAKVMGLSSHPHFMVTAEKVPRGQQGFAGILHFEAEGIHVSIEMARNSKVKVSEWNTYLKLCSSFNYLFMCTRTQYCLSLVNCKKLDDPTG
uniref:VWFD domain-containing protein n=1 Tax=Oreochromis niloticus TaxID=8128 RepID=I3KI08_ORENI